MAFKNWNEFEGFETYEILPNVNREYLMLYGKNLEPRARLSMLLDRNVMSHRTLAESTGIPRRTIDGYISGLCTLKIGQAAAIANFFGVRIDDIFGHEFDVQFLK